MTKYRYNRYRDLEIDISRLHFRGQDEFMRAIRSEYGRWADELERSRERFSAVMWLNVPKELSRVVPWLIDGEPAFTLHHATANRIMLVRPHPRALGGGAQIPSYGTHYVKVECVVVEDGTGNVLMVRERIGGAEHNPLKNVSGSAESGEFFADAAVREVLEETAIGCRFGCVIGVGNRTLTRFGRDEMIVGCLLFAPAGQTPVADGGEVSEALWCVPREVFQHCSQMAKEWLSAASNCTVSTFVRRHGPDIYRGSSYSMDFFMPG